MLRCRKKSLITILLPERMKANTPPRNTEPFLPPRPMNCNFCNRSRLELEHILKGISGPSNAESARWAKQLSKLSIWTANWQAAWAGGGRMPVSCRLLYHGWERFQLFSGSSSWPAFPRISQSSHHMFQEHTTVSELLQHGFLFLGNESYLATVIIVPGRTAGKRDPDFISLWQASCVTQSMCFSTRGKRRCC